MPARVFLDPPTLDLPRVSPNGKQLALAAALNRQQTMSVLDLTTGQPKPLGRLGTSVLTNVWWKGDDWLLLEVRDVRDKIAYRTVDVRTAKVNPLATLNNRGSRLGALLRDDPEHVLMLTSVGTATEIGRLNIRNGAARAVESVPGNVQRVAVGKNGVIAAQVAQGEKQFLLWRTDPAAHFEKRELKWDSQLEWVLLGAHADGRRIYIIDHTAAETARIALLDPRSGEQETIFASTEVDPDGLEFLSGWLGNAPVAARYETDRPRLHFFDDRAAQLHAQVDEALPGMVNEIVSISADGQVAVVRSRSDRNPGTFYVLNRAAGKLMAVGPRHAEIDPTRMGASRRISCFARDGIPIHGQVVIPAGPARPPVVVVANHAGGGARSRYEFDALAQLLATRGYATAFVDYRGTAGFGRAFLERGDQQIAQGMAGDLLDAVKWLGEQKLIDPTRVVLAGVGEGGLPAIHALAQSDLFAGWINWGTPMDFAPVTQRDFALQARGGTNAFTHPERWWQQKAYRDRINPIDQLPRIKVPAFHYAREEVIAAHYKRHPTPHVFAEHRQWDTQEEFIANRVAVLEQLFAFLAKHFPAEKL